MTHNFTKNDLILFIYKELDIEKMLLLSHAIDENDSLRSQYQKLMAKTNELPKVTFSPEKKTINSILAYSRR